MYRECIFIAVLSACILLTLAQSVNVVAVANSPVLIHGEAPHWDAETQSLYFIDRFSANVSIFRYDYKSGQFFSGSIWQNGVIQIQPSFVLPLKHPKHQYAVGIDNSVKIIKWNGIDPIAYVVDTLFEVEPWNGNKTHFNDAKADPSGRFYGGTMSIKVCNFATNTWGGLYQRSSRERVTVLHNQIKVSNGLTWVWDTDRDIFYYVDSCTLTIQRFHWNRRTGNIKDGSVAYDYSKGNVISFIPDGMTIDTNGTLYNALYQGAAVAVIDPALQSMHKISVPVQGTTSVTFGGPKLDILFLTTCYSIVDAFTGANIDHDESEPDAGKIFMITGLGRQGRDGDKLII